MMDNRIKKVVDGIKIKADMRENILLNLNSKTKNRKIKNSLRKNIIAICSIALVFIIGSGILSILNLSKEDEAELSNNFSFTVSVYAMESDGTYIEKSLIPNIPEDIPLVSLTDSSKVCVFSLKEFEDDYYFDIYDGETNEDVDFQIDSTTFRGEDGTLNFIIDPNTIIIYPKKDSTKIVIDAYDFDNKLVESMLLKIEETEDNYIVEIIEHDKIVRENTPGNISVEKGRALFIKVGTFEIPYESELDYKRFREMKPLSDKYTKETPYYDRWGKDKITYIGYSLNNSEFIAESDIPFSADIYTINGDMIATVKSVGEKGCHDVHIKFANKKYYIVLVNEDGKSTENGNYSIWK
jgi:hypothetical protein